MNKKECTGCLKRKARKIIYHLNLDDDLETFIQQNKGWLKDTSWDDLINIYKSKINEKDI
jgi:hypothetical protein